MQTKITTVSMGDQEMRMFIPAYQQFMGKTYQNPFLFLGVKTLAFKFEINKDGYVIVVETNRGLNNASIAAIRNTTNGFIGGWKACSGA